MAIEWMLEVCMVFIGILSMDSDKIIIFVAEIGNWGLGMFGLSVAQWNVLFNFDIIYKSK